MKRSTKVSRHEKRIAKIDLKIAVKTRLIRDLDKAMAKLHSQRTKLEEERRELNFDRADIEDKILEPEESLVDVAPGVERDANGHPVRLHMSPR